jgi:hypothetical protein
MLGAASLVGRHHVFEAVDLAHGGFEAVERARAGVGLIAAGHGRPLFIAHGVGAAVGQEVDVDVVAPEQKRVVPRLGDSLLALGAGGHPERFDALDLVGLGGDSFHSFARLVA